MIYIQLYKKYNSFTIRDYRQKYRYKIQDTEKIQDIKKIKDIEKIHNAKIV